jgi:uncharacterized membrane protein
MINKNTTDKREIIYTISRHSNLDAAGIHRQLTDEEVYATEKDWIKFIRWFLSGLGVSLLATGIIFFFAYNWADLHSFAKLGIVQAMIITVGCLVLFSKFSSEIKNLLLTGNAVLVGVLFAVFGQIYQTGANAWDFFLAWTFSITIWVVIAGYLPLWFIFIVLINVTLVEYVIQINHSLMGFTLFNLLAIINGVAVIVYYVLLHFKKVEKPANWFPNNLALFALSMVTFVVAAGIIDSDHNEVSFLFGFLLALAAFSAGIYYGIRTKSLFYLAIIPFCVLIIFCTLLAKSSDNFIALFFLEGIVITVGVTLLAKNLIHLKKKWNESV